MDEIIKTKAFASTKSADATVEVVITQSLYRLIDEALRERLINFEARIATLLSKREETKQIIEVFEPTFDDNFFDTGFNPR
jgi:hypothetical protein